MGRFKEVQRGQSTYVWATFKCIKLAYQLMSEFCGAMNILVNRKFGHERLFYKCEASLGYRQPRLMPCNRNKAHRKTGKSNLRCRNVFDFVT